MLFRLLFNGEVSDGVTVAVGFVWFDVRDDVELNIDDLRIGVTGAQPRLFVSAGVCGAPLLKIKTIQMKTLVDELFCIRNPIICIYYTSNVEVF